MAADGGNIYISFFGSNEDLVRLGTYISDKIEALKKAGLYNEDLVEEWSFLDGYQPVDHILESDFISRTFPRDPFFDSIESFCKELTQKFPEISFSGRLHHDWLITDSSPTQIEFLHWEHTDSLKWRVFWWEEERFDDDDEEKELPPTSIEEWTWTEEHGKIEEAHPSEQAGSLDLTLYELKSASFPLTLPVHGTAYAGRTERIEYVHEGDILILKADRKNMYYHPVAIEVFNSNNGSLGYLEADPGVLSKIADSLDILEASAQSVTPKSQRRKNAKYALLDVMINIRDNNPKG